MARDAPDDIHADERRPARLEDLDNGAQHADDGAGLGHQLGDVVRQQDLLGGALDAALGVGLDALGAGGGGEDLGAEVLRDLFGELRDELLERRGQLVEALGEGAVAVLDQLGQVVVGGGHAVDQVLEDLRELLQHLGRVGRRDDLVVLGREVEPVQHAAEILGLALTLAGRHQVRLRREALVLLVLRLLVPREKQGEALLEKRLVVGVEHGRRVPLVMAAVLVLVRVLVLVLALALVLSAGALVEDVVRVPHRVDAALRLFLGLPLGLLLRPVLLDLFHDSLLGTRNDERRLDQNCKSCWVSLVSPSTVCFLAPRHAVRLCVLHLVLVALPVGLPLLLHDLVRQRCPSRAALPAAPLVGLRVGDGALADVPVADPRPRALGALLGPLRAQEGLLADVVQAQRAVGLGAPHAHRDNVPARLAELDALPLVGRGVRVVVRLHQPRPELEESARRHGIEARPALLEPPAVDEAGQHGFHLTVLEPPVGDCRLRLRLLLVSLAAAAAAAAARLSPVLGARELDGLHLRDGQDLHARGVVLVEHAVEDALDKGQLVGAVGGGELRLRVRRRVDEGVDALFRELVDGAPDLVIEERGRLGRDLEVRLEVLLRHLLGPRVAVAALGVENGGQDALGLLERYRAMRQQRLQKRPVAVVVAVPQEVVHSRVAVALPARPLRRFVACASLAELDRWVAEGVGLAGARCEFH
ncbi:hypothetical protein O9K51_02730 [Purpureocillium lavendulum]|uniref:Uncharacterized protein n=1 Tax=Purpureocillium lavendulum TaxID=1247861 RepID=A0AB34G0D8_9HYPO|nr:hypothetical protein O9K51_02730 [Purpureocillium lavendulum]